jgi:hypothetical protein
MWVVQKASNQYRHTFCACVDLDFDRHPATTLRLPSALLAAADELVE